MWQAESAQNSSCVINQKRVRVKLVVSNRQIAERKNFIGLAIIDLCVLFSVFTKAIYLARSRIILTPLRALVNTNHIGKVQERLVKVGELVVGSVAGRVASLDIILVECNG